MSDPLQRLAESFSGTTLPEDPARVRLPEGSERWSPSLRREMSSDLTPAGVLIPVIARPAAPTVLLTRRSAGLRHHAGQVSFPGGRMEPGDRDIAATALRETHEEVGIPPRLVRVLGHLDPLPTITGFAVTPTVGLITEAFRLETDSGEVASAFEVPLDYLLERRNYRQTERPIRGRVLPIVEVEYDGERIWGATAYMLLRLIEKINENK